MHSFLFFFFKENILLNCLINRIATTICIITLKCIVFKLMLLLCKKQEMQRNKRQLTLLIQK